MARELCDRPLNISSANHHEAPNRGRHEKEHGRNTRGADRTSSLQLPFGTCSRCCPRRARNAAFPPAVSWRVRFRIGAADGLAFGPDAAVRDRLRRRPAAALSVWITCRGRINTPRSSAAYRTSSDVAVGGSGAPSRRGGGHRRRVIYVGEDGQAPAVRATASSAPTAIEAWNTNLYVTNSGDGTIARIDQQGARDDVPVRPQRCRNGPYGVSIGNGCGAMHSCDHATGAPCTRRLLAGNVTPPRVRSRPFGADLHAVRRPDGGVFVGDYGGMSMLWIVDDERRGLSLSPSGFAGQPVTARHRAHRHRHRRGRTALRRRRRSRRWRSTRRMPMRTR
jgi:hypothetical protein